MNSRRSTRFALVVGSDRYDDSDFEALRAPTSDVTELARVLSDPEIGCFDVRPPVVNQPAHVVTEEIEAFFSDRRSDDFLLLYMSCHGVLSGDRRLYFAATNTKRHRIRATGISDSFVNDVMRHSRARRIVLVLDCCHSGAFARGLVTKGNKDVGLEHRFEGRGRVTLTASTEIEYAFEGDAVDDLGHPARSSIFTRSLVDGLRTGDADRNRDGNVSIDELYDYVFERVRAETTDQTPGMSGDVRGDIFIARSPRKPEKPARYAAKREDRIPTRIEPGVTIIDLKGGQSDWVSIGIAANCVWAAPTTFNSSLMQIDPRSNQLVREPLKLGTFLLPASLAVHGEIVFVLVAKGLRLGVLRVDTATREVASTPEPVGWLSGKRLLQTWWAELAVIGDDLWTVSGQRVVSRLDPQRNKVMGQPIEVGRGPSSLAGDEDGIWVVNKEDDTVTRIDPSRNAVVAEVSVGKAPSDVAVGESAVWVANSGDATVTRIDPDRNEVAGEAIAVGRKPICITAGAGSVWVGNHDDDTVSRIDPKSHAVVSDPIPVARGPHPARFGHGAVWVGSTKRGALTRIDP